MHNIKATDLVSLRKRLDSRGDGTLDRVRAKLTEQQRQVLDRAVHSEWLPLEHVSAIYVAVTDILWPGQADAARRLGHELAMTSYSGVYRVFLAIPTTAYVIARAAKVWSSYHSTGSASVEDVTASSAVLVVRNARPLDACMINIIAGHVTALTELTGQKNVHVKVDTREPQALRWAISWAGGS